MFTNAAIEKLIQAMDPYMSPFDDLWAYTDDKLAITLTYFNSQTTVDLDLDDGYLKLTRFDKPLDIIELKQLTTFIEKLQNELTLKFSIVREKQNAHNR
jgi:hypothetical protein